MNRYIISWSRDDYGKIIIDAETAQEAQDKFDMGEWEDKDLNVKGGNFIAEQVELLEELDITGQ